MSLGAPKRAADRQETLARRYKEKTQTDPGEILIKNLLRWGILGTADVARKNWLAIRNSGNGTVAGVASRELGRAREFIQRCHAQEPMPEIPQAFGSYEALLASPSIDAVYIPLPTALRKEWVLRAAAARKHIVCEKPCAQDLSALRQMLEACHRSNVQFLDGVMFMHSRRLDAMRAALDDPKVIGSIRRTASAFTFHAPPEFFTGNIRAQPALEPHGCLGDLGWYCIRFSLWAMGWQMPQMVTGRILAEAQPAGASAPILTEFAGELLFQDGISAEFFCSFVAHNQEWAQVSGTSGYLRVEDFVVPFDGDEISFEVYQPEFLKSGCEFKMEPRVHRSTIAEHSQAHQSSQEANLFRQFANQVRSGQFNNDWLDWALKTQTVMEACLDSARQRRPRTVS
jgi:predicted dehydrogenase